MKKENLVINVVLFIAIAALYVLHFTGKERTGIQEGKPTSEIQKTSISEDIDLPIAYVNIDTLLNNMALYEDISENLTSKQQRLESNLSSQYRTFERDVNDFQEKVQKGLLTRREAQDLETTLSNRRMELENQRNQHLTELQEENMVSQNRVIDYIMNYLEEYNSDNKYRYILSYSFGGALLYASDALNITQEVLVGINQKYESEQASQK